MTATRFGGAEIDLRGEVRVAPDYALAAAIAFIVVLAAVLLAAPGHTVSARYLNDLMVFLDGGHRILAGQIPNRDFHTPLGPLVSLLPAAGLLLTGSRGAAMPAGIALLMLGLAPVIVHVLSSRLRPILALAMAAYLALILAAPANLGEDPWVLTFAMFYNRIGWVTLSLLLIMALPPAGGSSPVRDGCSAAVLLLVALYTKASFGVVGLGILLLLLLQEGQQRRWAVFALTATAAVTLLLELAWELPGGYVRDLVQTAQASGAVQGGGAKLLESFADNLLDYGLFAVVAALATFELRDWRMLLFLSFCAGAGLLIQNQNFQVSGIVTLAAGAVVGAEAIIRQTHQTRGVSRPTSLAALGLLLLLLAPTIVGRATALGAHVWLASTTPAHRFLLPRLDRIVTVETATAYDADYSARYAETLDDGAEALARTNSRGPVVVLDFANAFSVGLGYLPARGDYLVSQLGRTFDVEHFLPAEITLADARIVMEPKLGLDPPAVETFLRLYRAYLETNFTMVQQSAYWRIYLRREEK